MDSRAVVAAKHGNLSRPGIEPMAPTLAGGFLSTNASSGAPEYMYLPQIHMLNPHGDDTGKWDFWEVIRS